MAAPTPSLREMLDNVAMARGFTGMTGEDWADAIQTKFEDVGITSLRDFMVLAALVNRMLQSSGHRMLHHTTLVRMMRTSVDMVLGPAPLPVLTATTDAN
jgi:hypothetical protein